MLPPWSKALRENVLRLPKALKVGFPSIQRKVNNVDLRGAYLVYDKLTGLDRVRMAHEEVMLAEKNFIDRQLERRECQTECFRLEEARNRLNIQLDSVSRSDENFLTLVTQLHELSRQHKDAREKLSSVESAEQLAFEQFSGCLRRSQAEERVQANRMRQWSIGLSVLAGLVGFSATWVRFRHQATVHPASTVAVAAADKEVLLPVLRELQHTNEQWKETIASLSGVIESLKTDLSKNEATGSVASKTWQTVVEPVKGLLELGVAHWLSFELADRMVHGSDPVSTASVQAWAT
ncbi:hypothetical protein CRM22_003947 [Opisthorchis felineus]|uniref:Coiled-coil domain-containing protein 51 n=1 Tax=Opisthorchis felineus TaxID=147828 RepID=A0A4S2LYT1_OPIFE|nr:hypothetical protein CRM22_003947 [Opisthorchis felineus]